MLIIRSEQLDGFQKAEDEKFNIEVKDFLRLNIPEQVENNSDSQLLEIISQRREDCRKLAIETKRGIIGYVGIGFLLGEDFYGNPEFVNLINRDDVLPDDGIEYFYQETRKQL